MNVDDLTADLPAPREDEPESLRRDIVDELTDHLHCSLGRELLASGGRQPADSFNPDTFEQSAWQSVLNRFGNPAAIARRLWFDAMKEKLMARKIMAGSMACAAIAICLIAIVTWQRSNLDRQLVFESLEANRDQIQQMTAANQELLKKFQSTQQQLSEFVAGGSSNPEWVSGEVIVRQGSPEGPPAEGVRVELRPAKSNDTAFRAFATTDADGRADLGLMRVGGYYLAATTPQDVTMTFPVSLWPLKPFSRTIVAPANADSPVEASVRVIWPEGFDPAGVWILMLKGSLTQQVAGKVWGIRIPFRSSSEQWSHSNDVYAISPEGVLYDINQMRQSSDRDGTSHFWFMRDMETVSTLRLPDAEYSFSAIRFVVGLPSKDPRLSARMPIQANLVSSYFDDEARSMQTLTDESPRELVIRVPDEVVTAIETFRQEQDAATTLQSGSPRSHGDTEK